MNKFLNWQNQGTSNKNRLLAMLVGALIFLLTIPFFLVIVFPQVDKSLGLGSFFFGSGNIVLGAIAILLGGILAVWTILTQITLASGTPFPMLPTQKLLVVGPFKYCRNPMTLGTIIAYAGIAVWVGSLTALIVVALFALFLVSYLKLIEEKELELRFGSEYSEYKKRTPFMIPIKIARSDSKK